MTHLWPSWSKAHDSGYQRGRESAHRFLCLSPRHFVSSRAWVRIPLDAVFFCSSSTSSELSSFSRLSSLSLPFLSFPSKKNKKKISFFFFSFFDFSSCFFFSYAFLSSLFLAEERAIIFWQEKSQPPPFKGSQSRTLASFLGGQSRNK